MSTLSIQLQNINKIKNTVTMNKFIKRLKKLSKKALIQLIKHLRKEVFILHASVNELKEKQDNACLLFERRVNIVLDEMNILRKQLAKPVPPHFEIESVDPVELKQDMADAEFFTKEDS
jgi:hypothetical protein